MGVCVCLKALWYCKYCTEVCIRCNDKIPSLTGFISCEFSTVALYVGDSEDHIRASFKTKYRLAVEDINAPVQVHKYSTGFVWNPAILKWQD